MRKFSLVGIALCILLGSFQVQAAGLRSTKNPQALEPAAAYNPKANEQDIILPMPNDLEYVMRAVQVPAKRYVDDYEFNMGLENADGLREVYENQIPGYVGGAFRKVDLPRQWQEVLKKSGIDDKAADQHTFYFIGKYELTNGQWDAVMGTESSEPPNLPKTNISWYDIQEFLHKYNAWLLANHADKIPVIEGTPAFLRLPNEAEWEFAARGGNIPKENQTDNPYEGSRIDNYAIFASQFEKPQPIGSRNPNNLGIFDMAGNVSELVGDGFRFTLSTPKQGGGKEQRLHGTQGGLIRKGGSFQDSDEKDLYPGSRQEAKMFILQNGKFVPFRDRTMGTRLILTTLNVTGAKRSGLIEDQWAELRAGKKPLANAVTPDRKQQPAPQASATLVVIDRHGDPVTELQKIYGVADSEDMKKNLTQLRKLLEDNNEVYTREREENLMNNLRSVAYMADSLLNIAYRCYDADNTLAIAKLKQGFTKEMGKKFEGVIRDHYRNLGRSTNLYRINVDDLSKYPKNEIEGKLVQLKQQYKGSDRQNTNMRNNLDKLGYHIEIVRNKNRDALKDMTVWEQLIPSKEILNTLKKLHDSNA